MDRIHVLPWAPDDCDAALLGGRALTEVAPQGALTLAVADLAAHLDTRAAGPARAGGRRRSRSAVRAGRRAARAEPPGPGRRRAV